MSAEQPLNCRYYIEDEMVNHVKSINYMGMTTNTPAALTVILIPVYQFHFTNFTFQKVLFFQHKNVNIFQGYKRSVLRRFR